MLHEYHIFEMFPDGSSVWRASIPGRFNTQRKLQELAEHSDNEFLAFDFSTSNYLRLGALGSNLRSKIEYVRPLDTLTADRLPAPASPRAYSVATQPERRSRGSGT
jgi:hypothetical protein